MSEEESKGKKDLTFKQILLLQIQFCANKCSCEWQGGYWEDQINGQWTTRIYIPDSREVFIKSVSALSGLLSPYYDKEMKDTEEEITEELEGRCNFYKQKYQENKSEKDSFKNNWEEEKSKLFLHFFEALISLSKRLNFFEEERNVIKK